MSSPVQVSLMYGASGDPSNSMLPTAWIAMVSQTDCPSGSQ